MHGALPLHLAVVPRVASVLTEFPLAPATRVFVVASPCAAPCLPSSVACLECGINTEL